MFILIHHPPPKSLISQIRRLERSLTFEIVSLPLDNLDTQHPPCLFFFFFLTHQTCEFATFFFLSLSLVEIESRCCRKIEIEICSIARTLKIKFYVLSVLRIAGCFAIFKKNTNNNIMDNLVLINCLYQKK